MRVKWWALLFGIAILGIVILADIGQLGRLGFLYGFRYGDKAGHFLLFGILNLLVNLAAFEQWPRVRRLTLALRVDAIQMALMAIEELSQMLFPQRTFSMLDVLAGYLGVAAFTGVALLVSSRRAVQSPP